ncbi:hypothetical protein BT96DRAFT_996631 [Gymnopus androsaceus JB14]|uniref:Uncharacterized protein n=1 Tax=Gymnopus androsaceus JB14 TaxID=1447944 RepID=A0A6A4HF45_9AGAR|nr:hypothetical protein BT96DRAFT_996631 [Gymnopus androsaceus JB14]
MGPLCNCRLYSYLTRYMDLQLSQRTSSSATLLSDENNASETKTVVSEQEYAIESGHQEFRQICNYASVLHPAKRFIFPNTTATTSFPMIHVLEIDDIMAPQNTNESAVAIIQGLNVGYFESWTLASEHVRVTGAVYSLHSTLREARICYMQALVGGEVCFIHDNGLSESAVMADIPLGQSMRSWWHWCWRDNHLPIPSIEP